MPRGGAAPEIKWESSRWGNPPPLSGGIAEEDCKDSRLTKSTAYPFFFSNSFIKATSASTPSSGNAL